jgi:hypothetical protein
LAVIVAVLAVAVVVVACGKKAVGPDVTGMNLANAESQLDSAGISYQTHAQDGTFGIIVPDNWTVCSEDYINSTTVMLNAAKYGC